MRDHDALVIKTNVILEEVEAKLDDYVRRMGYIKRTDLSEGGNTMKTRKGLQIQAQFSLKC